MAWLFWHFTVPAKRPTEVLLKVKKDDLPANGALVYRESRVAVVRIASSVYALSLVCPHLGCTVNLTAEHFVCPCHGSTFGSDGKVLEGPADRALKRLQVEDRGDSLVVVS